MRDKLASPNTASYISDIQTTWLEQSLRLSPSPGGAFVHEEEEGGGRRRGRKLRFERGKKMIRTKTVEGQWKGFKSLSPHTGETVGAGKKG